MNDIIEPTKPGTEGISPAKPGEPLNLRTPEQDAADAQAKKDREARLMAQARVQQINRVDGMAYGPGAQKGPNQVSVAPAQKPEAQLNTPTLTPQPEMPSTPSSSSSEAPDGSSLFNIGDEADHPPGDPNNVQSTVPGTEAPAQPIEQPAVQPSKKHWWQFGKK